MTTMPNAVQTWVLLAILVILGAGVVVGAASDSAVAGLCTALGGAVMCCISAPFIVVLIGKRKTRKTDVRHR